MSRTAAGVIQQFPNDTCNVYITYSKEEEAVHCIQNVHGFVLEGKPLRAFFGTTKYCHAWLRNVPCSNLDCLYLHETGSQEDSFTKDEIISAYTRCFCDNLERFDYQLWVVFVPIVVPHILLILLLLFVGSSSSLTTIKANK